MCILVQTNQEWDIINNALVKGGKREVSDVLYSFEIILCFDTWVNKTEFWSFNDNKRYVESGKESIKCMMKDIKSFLPKSSRKQG